MLIKHNECNWFWVGEIHFHPPKYLKDDCTAANYDLDPALYFQLEYSQLLCNMYPVNNKNSVFTGYSIIENPYDQI